MSDFNQSSHNFEKFVEKLTSLDGDGDEDSDDGQMIQSDYSHFGAKALTEECKLVQTPIELTY